MDSKPKKITSGILAVLTATVVACGSIQGAAGRPDVQAGGGSNYITADGSYGVGLGELNRDYPQQERDVPEYLRAQLAAATEVSGSTARSDAAAPMLQP